MKKIGIGLCIATLIICGIGTILAAIGAVLSILQNDWLGVLVDILLILSNGLNIYISIIQCYQMNLIGRRKSI